MGLFTSPHPLDCADAECAAESCRVRSRGGWMKLSEKDSSLCPTIGPSQAAAAFSGSINAATINAASAASRNAARAASINAAMELLLSQIQAEKLQTESGGSETFRVLAEKLGSAVTALGAQQSNPTLLRFGGQETGAGEAVGSSAGIGSSAAATAQPLVLHGTDFSALSTLSVNQTTQVSGSSAAPSVLPIPLLKRALAQKSLGPLVENVRLGKIQLDYEELNSYTSEEGWTILCWLCHVGSLVEQDSLNDCGKVGCCESDESPTPEGFLSDCAELLNLLLEGTGNFRVPTEGGIPLGGSGSIHSKADPNAACAFGGVTPLMFAAEGGNLEMFEMLLAHGANPQQRDEDDDAVLNLLDSLERRGKWGKTIGKLRKLLEKYAI